MDKPITAIGQVTRVMAVRLNPGMDVLRGLTDACLEHGINNGVIVSGIGGVTRSVERSAGAGGGSSLRTSPFGGAWKGAGLGFAKAGS